MADDDSDYDLSDGSTPNAGSFDFSQQQQPSQQQSSQQPSSSGGSLSDMQNAAEQKYGLPSGYMARTGQIESGNNPNAYNKSSGAAGMYQFIPSTWKAYGNGGNPYDPAQSIDAAARLARDNMNSLQSSLGRAPTAAELYLAHQQGAGGAASLINNPNASASSIVGNRAVTLNGGTSNMSAGSFANLWLNKFGNGGGGGGGLQPSAQQTASANPSAPSTSGAMSPMGYGSVGQAGQANPMGSRASDLLSALGGASAAPTPSPIMGAPQQGATHPSASSLIDNYGASAPNGPSSLGPYGMLMPWLYAPKQG